MCSMLANKQGTAGECCLPEAHVTIPDTIMQCIPSSLILVNVLMDSKEGDLCFSQRKTRDGERSLEKQCS